MLHSARRLLSAALAAAVLLTVGFALPTLPAMAADAPAPTPAGSEPGSAAASPDSLVTFGVAPAGPAKPDDRPFLKYTVAPGSVIRDHVAVLNQAGAPLELDVYPSDVAPGANGGLEVPAREVAATGAGSWVTTDVTHIQVAGQSQDGVGFTVVPFTVTVPTNAEPGDHVAVVVAALTTQGESGTNTPALNLEQRVAARLYITVDGALSPGLVITDLGVSYAGAGLATAGNVQVGYVLENTGNVRMAVSPSVTVTGPFGLLPRTAPGTRIEELLPGGKVPQSVTVPNVWPLGRLTATVAVAAAASVGGSDPRLAPVSASASVWAWPWLLLGLVALLLGLVAWRIVRRRRRRGTAAAPPSADSRRARRHAPAPVPPTAVPDRATVR